MKEDFPTPGGPEFIEPFVLKKHFMTIFLMAIYGYGSSPVNLKKLHALAAALF